MRDKIKVLIITSIICLFYGGVAFGYTGDGTRGNPYIVSNAGELTKILDKKGSNDWVYISLKSNIKINLKHINKSAINLNCFYQKLKQFLLLSNTLLGYA